MMDYEGYQEEESRVLGRMVQSGDIKTCQA